METPKLHWFVSSSEVPNTYHFYSSDSKHFFSLKPYLVPNPCTNLYTSKDLELREFWLVGFFWFFFKVSNRTDFQLKARISGISLLLGKFLVISERAQPFYITGDKTQTLSVWFSSLKGTFYYLSK